MYSILFIYFLQLYITQSILINALFIYIYIFFFITVCSLFLFLRT